MLQIPRSVIAATLSSLQKDGLNHRESVVLWLGPTAGSSVTTVYRPYHQATYDHFYVPPTAVRTLLSFLSEHRLRTSNTTAQRTVP